MQTMRTTAIPPKKIMRRASATQKWHLWDHHGDDGETMYCGQTMRLWTGRQVRMAYDATQITCDDCLVAAISKAGDASKLAISRGGAKR